MKLETTTLNLHILQCKFCCVISSRSLVSCNMFKCIIYVYGGHNCAPHIWPHKCLRGNDALSSCLLLQKKGHVFATICGLSLTLDGSQVLIIRIRTGCKTDAETQPGHEEWWRSWTLTSTSAAYRLSMLSRTNMNSPPRYRWPLPEWFQFDPNLVIFFVALRLGSVQICCSGTSSEKKSFQMRQTLLLGDVITPESPLYLHLQDHGDGAILGQT